MTRPSPTQPETDTSDLLAGLNPAQQQAAQHTTGPLLIVAGAGAGKTKTLTHRIANLIASGVPGHQILAITFTNKAAAELRERLQKILATTKQPGLPTAATFHALGVKILRQFGEVIGIKKNFSILDRSDQERLVREILKSFDLVGEEWSPKKVINYLSKRRDNRLGKSDQLERVWERYHTLKSERSLLDFDDLIYRTVQLLESNEPVTAALRQRWTHLHVDEYQDTNSAQYRLVQLLCGPERNLCVVGDTDQTIYTWRGAEIKNLMQFERDYPNTTTVLLEENYRSSKTIIAVANDCIRKNSTRIDKTLFTNNPDGDMVKLLVATSEQDEARQVARAVNQLIQTGAKPAEIALLYRANFQSQALEKAFISAGIQYDLLGTKFYARRAIKDMLAYLRFALNPDNAADLQRIAGVPKRGVGPKTTQAIIDGTVDQLSAGARSKAEKFIDELSGIRAAVNTKPVPEAIEHILAVTGWAQSLATDGSKSKAHNLENEDELENLAELITVAEQYADFEAPLGVEKLLEEAALMAEADTIDSEENQSVRMMTIHASKGLEFDHVFITGLEEGLFPSDRSDAARDQEEERRLFYVALTRARQTACLSYATMRHRFGSYTFNTPSEFITEIDPQYLDDSLAGASGSSGTNRLLDIEF